MSYATIESFLERGIREKELIDLSDKAEPSTGQIVEEVIERAIDDAGATIDAAIATAGYMTPVLVPPALIVRLCVDIARYYLHNRNIDRPDSTRSEVRIRYEDALKTLIAIRDGLLEVPGGVRPEDSAAYYGIVAGHKHPLFDDALLAAYGPGRDVHGFFGDTWRLT